MAQASDDPLDGLEERLANHAKAFDSLLALTPAREYYGSQIDDGRDPSDQWNRKKQTKEEKRAAKKAKLDPANQKSALDVMKEREKKRKRDLGMEEDGEDTEVASSKAQKVEVDDDAAEAKRRAKADKRKETRQRKQEKAAKKKAKADARKAARQEAQLAELESEKRRTAADIEGPEQIESGADIEAVDVSGLGNLGQDIDGEDSDAGEVSSAPTSPVVNSPAFDVATNQSDTSSSSSILPPPTADTKSGLIQNIPNSAKPQLNLQTAAFTVPAAASVAAPRQRRDPPSGTSSPKIQLPDIDQAELQERLRKRIEELRARRKADGPDSKPARSRQELLEQRRKKEEQRKAHKKELRRQAKEEEARKREEQLRGSGSPLSADIFNPGSPRPQENNFSFSRLAFEDGTAADASLTALHDPRKRKGPQDPRTALQAAEKKASRLSGLDAEKRADIAEKDMWLNAKKRAHGERVRDDTSLLKKALKRKEKQKNKSEKDWKEREQAIVKGREMKQKKRETNLQKRRDEKGKKKSGSGGKKKGRPGFEGRFKA